ncbi:heat shock 70 kDa protein 12A-like [Dreissena polymorpha]|uniref:heat shock 70 kDa protein 12A-like n=1 Tax=Dreissena polymorpha TaxID=45954 RepID=UPI002264E777|nr:heat shock 70 kDa protein 12A-like [Dreissena polymorpha]
MAESSHFISKRTTHGRKEEKPLKYDEVGGGPKKAQSRGKLFNRFRELNDAQLNHGEVGGRRAKRGSHVPVFDDEEEVDHGQVGDPANVSINQNWVAGSMSLVSPKAPTVVLFEGDQTFHSFGYEAENNYSELALDGEHMDYFFFKRFKMRLRGKKLLENRRTGVDNKDIHWVLTVPAIWSDAAKQLMREAAQKAGIDGGQLSIALEPEAASMYCQLIPTNKMQGCEGAKFQVALAGTKYMVIDLGGGTADIIVYQRMQDGGLKELHTASGGAWGGTTVDDGFYNMIIKIIGGPVWSKFKDKKAGTADYHDLQRELETKKRTITPESTGKISIKVPVTIVQTYEKESGETIDEAIDGSDYNGKIKWFIDKIRIDAKVFQDLFKPCTDKIVAHIKSLFQDPQVKDTKIFLMVGGLSESAMVQNAVKKAFPDCKVIIPDEAGLCILKGAVIFGHKLVYT